MTTKHYVRKAHRAFTLIEVMVVLFILMVIAGAAVGTFRGIRAGAQRDATKLYINNIASALEFYELAVGNFPSTDQGLQALIYCPSDVDVSKWGTESYIKQTTSAIDPWNNPYQYISPGRRATSAGFDLWSFGPDGIDGTDDDIGNW